MHMHIFTYLVPIATSLHVALACTHVHVHYTTHTHTRNHTLERRVFPAGQDRLCKSYSDASNISLTEVPLAPFPSAFHLDRAEWERSICPGNDQAVDVSFMLR